MGDSLDELLRQMITLEDGAERARLEREAVELARRVAIQVARANRLSDDDAADVAQHASGKLLETATSAGLKANAEGLVWRVAENRCRDLHRRRKSNTEGRARLRNELEASTATSADPESMWIRAETRAWATATVRAALAEAPNNYRAVLQRHFIDGEPIEAIAGGYYEAAVEAGEVDLADPRAVQAARRKARNRADQHLKRARDWMRARLVRAMDAEDGA